jgi:2-dehydropantoate 2-reductase
MKILVIGAGVLGSVYAARLQDTGHMVTVLARGQRLRALQQNGILLENEASGERTCTRVQVIDALQANDAYDLAIVLVRNNQLSSVLPALAANKGIPAILFMVNQARGPQALIEAVGEQRVLLGFPGAGGEKEGDLVRYRIVPGLVQQTTIGELHGRPSVRLQAIAQALRSAGFPTATCANMDAWLKTHVALVSPIANAIYLAGGSNYRLAHTRDGLVLMLRGVREGFQVVQALGLPITPARLRPLQWLPEPLLVWLLQIGFDTRPAELVLARHANAARDEMLALADEFKSLAQQTTVPTPAMDALYPYIDPEKEALAAGSHQLPVAWKESVPYLITGLALGVAIWAARKKE